MSLRKVNPQVIVDTKIMAVQAGLTGISTEALEAHYLAGGNRWPSICSSASRREGWSATSPKAAVSRIGS
jgi:uncharacterized protein YqfA (UPF0365 family)